MQFTHCVYPATISNQSCKYCICWLVDKRKEQLSHNTIEHCIVLREYNRRFRVRLWILSIYDRIPMQVNCNGQTALRPPRPLEALLEFGRRVNLAGRSPRASPLERSRIEWQCKWNARSSDAGALCSRILIWMGALEFSRSSGSRALGRSHWLQEEKTRK